MSRTWDASTSKQGPEVKKKAWIKGFLAREPPGGIAGHLSAAGINPHIVMKTGPPRRLTPCGVVQRCPGDPCQEARDPYQTMAPRVNQGRTKI